MNQILNTEAKQNKEPKQKSRGAKGPLPIEGIITFFSICLILFGIISVGEGTYAVIENGSENKDKQKDTIPTVEIARNEDIISISVFHDKAIDKITYNWNGLEDMVLQGKGRTSFTEQIKLPAGNNELNIIIRDILGKEVRYRKEYILEDGDVIKPEISLSVTGKNVKITATDNEKMAYITYRWNEEEEIKVDVTR